MNDLDFLPQWYRTGRKRRIWYQRQYVVLAAAAAMLCLWCFAAGKSLAHADAEIKKFQSEFESGVQKVQRYRQIETRFEYLQDRANVLDAISPRTQVWPALAEMSAVVNANVVLSRVEFSQEGFEKENKSAARPQTLVQFDGDRVKDKDNIINREPMRTKVTLAGVAASGAEVAELISQLEKSPYFCRIQPIFSRDRQVSGHDVTEFEIHMYIADYRQAEGSGQL